MPRSTSIWHLVYISNAKAKNERNMDPFAFSEKTMEYLEKMVYMKENFDNLNLGQVDKVKFQSINEYGYRLRQYIPDQWNIVPKRKGGVKYQRG